MVTKKSLSALKMAYISLGAVLIALCSWISVPATVPFTLQTFAVLLVCDLLGGRWGLVWVLLYLLLGAVGFPVFSGFSGGLGHLLGMTGGYILGYILAALVVALLRKHWGDSYWKLCLSMVIGVAVCYLFGTVWYMILTGTGLWVSLLNCVFPFLIGDALKILLAAFLTIRLKAVVK